MDHSQQRLTIQPIPHGNFNPGMDGWMATGGYTVERPNGPPMHSPEAYSAVSMGAPPSATDSMRGPASSFDATTPHIHHSRERSNTSNSKSQQGDDSQGQGPPSWAEMKTKAGKDRKRLPLACIACRRKKIRCSGEKPACKHCMKSRVPCVYKVTTRKATPRTDYMAMLDKRMKRMEDRVIKMIPKEEQTQALQTMPRAVVKPQSTMPHRPTKRSADEAFNADLKNWALTGGDSAYKHRLSSAPGPKMQEHEDDAFLKEGQEHLPSQEIQEHLAEIYFDYVYGQSYLLLHKPSYMRRLRAREIPPVLSLAVCGISARFSEHPQLQSSSEPSFLRGQIWANAAQDVVLSYFDSPSVTSCTVLLLLSLHGFGTCQGGRSWMCSGMAHRMAYALSLHKEPEDGFQDLSFACQEARRRTLWSCFMNDRFNSSGTFRPMFMGEEQLTTRLPVKESFFLLEHPGKTERLEGPSARSSDGSTKLPEGEKNDMGLAAYSVRLIALWGRLVQYLNLGGRLRDDYPIWNSRSGWQTLADQITEFNTRLPDHLRYNADNLASHHAENIANQFLYLHISYNQLKLFLYRFAFPTTAIYTPCKGIPNQYLSNARKAALDAAANVSNLVDEALDYRCVVPFAGYAAYSSSAVHIYGCFSKNAALEEASKTNLKKNLKYLSKMRRYWGMFNFLTENLKELYRQHQDAALKGISTPDPQAGAQKVVQYADWHEQFPQGVSHTNFEEPIIKDERTDEKALSHDTNLQTVEEFFASLSPSAVPQPQTKRPRKGTVRNSVAVPVNNTQPTINPQPPDRRSSMPNPNAHNEFNPYGISNTPSYQLPEHFDRTQITPQPPPPPPPHSATSAHFPLQSPQSAHPTFSNGFPPQLQHPGMVPQLHHQPISSNAFDNPMSGLEASELDYMNVDMSQFNQDYLNINQPSGGGAWFMPFNFDFPGGVMDMPPEMAGQPNPLPPQQDARYCMSRKMENGN
ncbi:MAG: hypothetical protein M1828_001907 [Chrysothrix sp. TS-e1954]|nr:MAG: hypothetical protein M1828_001907 [Chrysothrix sp. TS-e1954]